MEVRYSSQPAYTEDGPSVFLVGPTPRSKDVPSWRPEALALFEKFKFNGTVCVPEVASGERFAGYDNQIEWEWTSLLHCRYIMAWVPRCMQTMPALTTNIEFGYWMAKDPKKVLYGRPENAPSTRYLDALYFHSTGGFSPQSTLESLVYMVVERELGLRLRSQNGSQS